MEQRPGPDGAHLGWAERIYASVPLPAGAVGASIAGVLVLAFAVSEIALGRHLLLRDVADPWAALTDARIAVVHCLLAAYLPTAYVYLQRGHRATLGQLRDDLDCSNAQMADLRTRLGRYGPVALGLAGIAGIGMVLFLTRETTPEQIALWAWHAQIPEIRWHRVLGLWVGWWFGIFILALAVGGTRLARLATRVARVDLLDLRPLRPFTRQALQSALLMAGGFGITLLILVDSGAWLVVLCFWISSMMLILIGLLAWLLPLHRVIRAAKLGELDWCRDALIRERAKLREAGAERSRIDEIVAYRSVVEGVSAWPTDGSTAVRLSLYLLLPLGSWAGGALVERLVDALLG